MNEEQKALLALWKRNPVWLFECGDLVKMMNATQKLITAIRTARDTPFIGTRCRPEWVLAWLKDHPGFTAK